MPALDAVLLDRDGTINVKAPAGHYVTSPAQLRLLPNAAAAIRLLNLAAVPVFVVTNQRGVALGRMTEAELADVHRELQRLLADQHAHLDGIYACVHDNGCPCRKPNPGLVRQVLHDHPSVDITRVALIGDADTDEALGRRCGIRTIRVTPGTPNSQPDAQPDAPTPTGTAEDLLAAVQTLLTG